MLLITFHEWLGPGRKLSFDNRKKLEMSSVLPIEKDVAFVSQGLSLYEALQKVLNYQKAYNEFYDLAINFSLIGVAKIDSPVPKELFSALNVSNVNDLKQTVEEFEEE